MRERKEVQSMLRAVSGESGDVALRFGEQIAGEVLEAGITATVATAVAETYDDN